MLSPGEHRSGDGATPIEIRPAAKDLTELRLPSGAIQNHRETPSPSRFGYAHSCPAGRAIHDVPPRIGHFPRSPQIGSLPDPTFAFLNAPMPPLELPPMNRDSLSEERFASPLNPPPMLQTRPNETVVQFASSCPAQLDGFLTRMTLDESQNLLSQSPSLVVLRDMRRHSSFYDQSSNRRSLDRHLIDERDEYESSDDGDGDDDDDDEVVGNHRDSQEGVFMLEMS